MGIEILFFIAIACILIICAIQDFQIRKLKYEVDLAHKELERKASQFRFDLYVDRVDNLEQRTDLLRTDMYRDANKLEMRLQSNIEDLHQINQALSKHLKLNIKRQTREFVVEKKQ